MDEIEFVTGDESLLGRISLLWEKLNAQHMDVSQFFADAFAVNTFERRRKGLLEKAAQGKMRVELALLSGDEKPVGYCVSSVTSSGVGEIESIYIAG